VAEASPLARNVLRGRNADSTWSERRAATGRTHIHRLSMRINHMNTARRQLFHATTLSRADVKTQPLMQHTTLIEPSVSGRVLNCRLVASIFSSCGSRKRVGISHRCSHRFRCRDITASDSDTDLEIDTNNT